MTLSSEIYVNDVLVLDVPSEATDWVQPFATRIVPAATYMVVPLTDNPDTTSWAWGTTHQRDIIERIE